MKEEWRTVVVDGKKHPWYSVSNFGNVRTHLQNISLGRHRGFNRSFNPNLCKDLTPIERKNQDGSISRLEVKFQFPEDFFEDYQYRKKRDTDSNVRKPCSVHKLVMEAFRPMDEYPPDRLEDCWNDIPEDAKTWIKETVTINHIDHDPANNCVDNLEYVTQRENTRAAVKHYGGNCANKGKKKDDEFLTIIRPEFNFLLQEWEDGRIEFHGDEGEKIYAMLEEMNKGRDESISDTFWDIIRKYDESDLMEVISNEKTT